MMAPSITDLPGPGLGAGIRHLLREANLFDADWYVETYPDVPMLGMDPFDHFVLYGAYLNRSPSRAFDPIAYLERNPDVARSGVNAIVHYLTAGLAEGRSPRGCPRLASPTDLLSPEPDVPLDADPSPTIERRIPSDAKSQYSIIAAAFDTEYYCRRNPDIAHGRIDPVRHFIQHGAREGRNPTPDFDVRYYIGRYPEVKAANVNPFLHYLVVGRHEGLCPSPLSSGDPAFDYLASMLGRSAGEVDGLLAKRRRYVRDRLLRGRLADMVERAARHEPLIKHATRAAFEVGLAPFRSDTVNQQMAAMHRMQEEAGWRRARVAVLLPWIHVSGAARIAGHLAEALASLLGADEIVVIRTETSELQFPDWFPAGCRHVDFAAAASPLRGVARQRLLCEFLRSLCPAHVFNVNSRTFWEAMEKFSGALGVCMRLHAYLFCNEKNVYGDWVGYPVRNFHRFFDDHASMICDSEFLRSELAGRGCVPPAQRGRLVVLRTPATDAPDPVPCPAAAPDRRPQVFWAGRFDRQKRVDVAYAIAEQMPDVDFRLWGEPVLDREFSQLVKPSNVRLEGVYQRFSDLPLEECDAWLYTSEWDGVPNMLIEVASAGLPLVGSLAGGTGEVLVEGHAERVTDIDDAEAYTRALRRIFADPAAARERALGLRRLVLDERMAARFRADVQHLIEAEGMHGEH